MVRSVQYIGLGIAEEPFSGRIPETNYAFGRTTNAAAAVPSIGL
jgi:hypothetical protein